MTQRRQIHRLLTGKLVRRPVSYEKRLATPLERHALALRYQVELHFDLSESKYVSGRTHRREELVNQGLGDVCRRNATRWVQLNQRYFKANLFFYILPLTSITVSRCVCVCLLPVVVKICSQVAKIQKKITYTESNTSSRMVKVLLFSSMTFIFKVKLLAF